VIFLVDVKMTFDEFKQSVTGTCDHKTIITTNPGGIYYYHIILVIVLCRMSTSSQFVSLHAVTTIG